MFINRSRIMQIGTGTPQDPRAYQNPRVFYTFAAGQVYETVAQAMPNVPANERPPEADWWQYAMEQEIRAYAYSDVKGVIPYAASSPTKTLIVDGSFWQTQAQQVGGSPAIAINTFGFVFGPKPKDWGAVVERVTYDWLIQASFFGWTGDRRDPALTAQASTNPADDPSGVLQNNKLKSLDKTFITILKWHADY